MQPKPEAKKCWTMVTSEQCKEACGLLGWSQQTLRAGGYRVGAPARSRTEPASPRDA
jgi:hypothetical protein